MGAALRFPDVQRPRFTETLYFTKIPDPIWTDSEVSDLAVRVHGYLVLWERTHPGRFPSVREVALAIGRADCTVRRAIQSLESAGYVLLEREGKRSRYQASTGYELRSPGPKLARPLVPDPQRRLFPAEPDERAPAIVKARTSDRQSAQPCAPPINTESQKTDRLANTREVCLSGAPQQAEIPRAEPQSQSEAPTDKDYLACLTQRAGDLVRGASAEAVGAAVAEFGFETVGQAIETAERRNPAPVHWAFILAMLANWRREAKLAKITARPAPQRTTEWTGHGVAPLTTADMPSEAELPGLLELAASRGPLADIAKAQIRSWVLAGLLDVGRVPWESLAPKGEGRPGARSANSPPGRLEVMADDRPIIPRT
ncbi:MAG: winged helix-turn-helix domain-containing protein [Candidatus Limnocylindrales bacterium]